MSAMSQFAAKAARLWALIAVMLCVTPSAFLQGGSAFAQTLFLQDLEDMPLAPGLVEIDSERVMFDKPEGRIVRTAAEGTVSSDAVRGFYVKTLPSLGWVAVAPGAQTPNGQTVWFDREGERLEIRWELTSSASPAPDRPKILLVRFALQPR